MAKGNTEVIAEMIQKNIGGELFEIDTVKNYPVDYTECTNVAKDELKNKKICPTAEVFNGLAIHGAEASQSAAQVKQWLKQL